MISRHPSRQTPFGDRVIRDRIAGPPRDPPDIGTVLSVGEGIARVSGLGEAMAGEMVAFAEGLFGMALNLDEDSVGVVLLGDGQRVRQDDRVRRTGRVMSVPVGEALVGRVVNALGQPLDGKGPIATFTRAPIERMAPGIPDRQRVREPLQTGIKAIDALVSGVEPRDHLGTRSVSSVVKPRRRR